MVKTLFVLGGIIAGYVACKVFIKDKVSIKNKISIIDWSYPIISLFLIILICMTFECAFCLSINNSEKWNMVFRLLVQGGLLIPVICFIASIYFGCLIRYFKLDWNPLYSEKTAKIIITAMIVINCFLISAVVYIDRAVISEEKIEVYNRVIIWFITAVSIWIPAGAGCKGLRELYLEKSNAGFGQAIKKELCRYVFKIFICMVFICVVSAVIGVSKTVQRIFNDNLCHMVCAVTAYVLTVIIIAVFTRPPLIISKMILEKAIQKKSGKEHRYCRLKYTISKNGNDVKVRISQYEVEWPNEENKEKQLKVDKKVKDSFMRNEHEFTNGPELHDAICEYIKIIQSTREKSVATVRKKYLEVYKNKIEKGESVL